MLNGDESGSHRCKGMKILAPYGSIMTTLPRADPTSFVSFLSSLLELDDQVLCLANPLPYTVRLCISSTITKCFGLSRCIELGSTSFSTVQRIHLGGLSIGFERPRAIFDAGNALFIEIDDHEHLIAIALNSMHVNALLHEGLEELDDGECVVTNYVGIEKHNKARILSLSSTQPFEVCKPNERTLHVFFDNSSTVVISETPLESLRIAQVLNALLRIPQPRVSMPLVELLDKVVIVEEVSFYSNVVSMKLRNVLPVPSNAMLRVYGFVDYVRIGNERFDNPKPTISIAVAPRASLFIEMRVLRIEPELYELKKRVLSNLAEPSHY